MPHRADNDLNYRSGKHSFRDHHLIWLIYCGHNGMAVFSDLSMDLQEEDLYSF